MKNKTMLAYQIIERTDFSKDYDVIEQQLKPIIENKITDTELVDSLKGMFEDLQVKRNVTKERLELFVYDINDINYILYDGKNEKLKKLENEIGMIVDSMSE